MGEPLPNATQETKDNLGDQGTTNIVFLRKQEDVFAFEGPTQIGKETTGNAAVYGSSTNGIYGINTATSNGLQQVYGAAGIAILVQAVSNPNNTYYDFLERTDFWDTTTSTATLDTVNQEITFTASQFMQSDSIYLDSTSNVLTMTLIMVDEMFTDPTEFTFEASPDGGTTFESITLNEQHTFTATGADLRIKITCSDAETLSVVTPTLFANTPLTVTYTTST